MKPTPALRPATLVVAAFLAALAANAHATAEEPLPAQTRSARWGLGYEELKLPGDETLGLVGAHYVVELAPGWWLGPSLYGAARGERGGFFTFGAEGQRNWRLGERWSLVGGLYVGGGGGAAAPVGGGLMLRPHLDLMHEFGGWAAGVSASQVWFPNGDIRDTQLGLMLAWHSDFGFVDPGRSGQRALFGNSGGGFGVEHMNVALGRYRKASNGDTDLTHVGMRLEWAIEGPWSATLEAAGAAGGGSDGYAEALGGVTGLWPLGTPAVQAGLHAAVGLAGGGAMPTGGGTIGKLALTTRWQLTRQLSLDLEAGRVQAFDGDLSTPYAQISLGLQLVDKPSDGPQTVNDAQWSLALQHYAHAKRKDGSTRGMETIGLKFQRTLGEHAYLSGQAHSAFDGGAGAYSAGLVGAGLMLAAAPDNGWNAGAEWLLGAAGGGGVAISGGAITQGQAWVEQRISRHQRVQAGLGWIHALKGDLSSPVVELAWSWAFGVP